MSFSFVFCLFGQLDAVYKNAKEEKKTQASEYHGVSHEKPDPGGIESPDSQRPNNTDKEPNPIFFLSHGMDCN